MTSRTVKAGTVARVKYARFNDDFSVESGEMVKQFDGVLDAEKVEKALHNAVAVPIDRPLSQQ